MTNMEIKDRETLDHLKSLTTILDSQFSVAGFKFGLDGVIGLVPGLGDAIGGLISLYIVYKAHVAGVSAEVTGRMMLNILIDVFLGSVPVIGDLFDFFYKVNEKNLRLMEEYFNKKYQQKHG